MSNPGNLSVCLLRNFLEEALPGAGYKHLHLHHYTCSPEWGARVLSWAVVQKPQLQAGGPGCLENRSGVLRVLGAHAGG